MAPATKFTFDLDFDAPDEALQPEMVEEVEVEEEEVVLTFSEEELAHARDEGFKAGKEEGRKEFAEATEQRILETVDSVSENLTNIFSEQAQANQDIAKEMIQISTAIAKKMFPDLNSRNALGEVERVVQDTLKAITDEPRVQIMVHPDLREPLTERLSAMTQRAGFDGKVYVNPDTTVNLGDCRVEWSHGAAVRDSETIMEQIDAIIARNLHGDDTDTPETAEGEASVEDITNDKANDSETEIQAHEAEEIVQSDAENTESSTNDLQEAPQQEPSAPIENTTEDFNDTAPLDDADQNLDNDHDNFTPSANFDDDVSAQGSDTGILEDQQTDPEQGEVPTPNIGLEQNQAPDETTDNIDDTEDSAEPMVNSDPVSPDMTAAILDVQGALSEEDEK